MLITVYSAFIGETLKKKKKKGFPKTWYTKIFALHETVVVQVLVTTQAPGICSIKKSNVCLKAEIVQYFFFRCSPNSWSSRN